MSTNNLRPLGHIVRLQIQRASLKTGQKPNRQYDPAPLLAVDELTLTPEGALVSAPDGERLMDIHHARHPQTHNVDNANPLSVNFTSHYAMMCAEFGGHVWNGCAGENILVETPVHVTLDMLARGLAIQPQGGGEVIWLREVLVAHPCRPFSGYVMGGTEATVKEALQFLDDGMRGFYCTLFNIDSAMITVGDSVYVPGA